MHARLGISASSPLAAVPTSDVHGADSPMESQAKTMPASASRSFPTREPEFQRKSPITGVGAPGKPLTPWIVTRCFSFLVLLQSAVEKE